MDKESNIGYPGSEEEIETFGKLLKSSAKNLSDEQFTAIVDYLKANAPKPRASTSNMPVVKPDSLLKSNMQVLKPDSSKASNMPVIKKN